MSTGKKVKVGVVGLGFGAEFVPLAMLFNDNPYQLLNPPNPDGGFYQQGK